MSFLCGAARTRLPWPLLGLLMLAAAACAGGAAGSTTTGSGATGANAPAAPTTTIVQPSAEPPEWLDLFADYPRYLQHKRRLAIATTNNGATEIEVTLIGLAADHFARLEPEAKTATIGPGTRTDLQVDFGEVVDCDATGPLTALVEIELVVGPDPAPRRFVIPIDPAPLDVIRHTECSQQVVRDAVDIGFDQDWVVDGTVLAARLVLGRNTGDEVVTVSSVRGTEIIGLHPVPPSLDPVAVIEPGTPGLAVPVELEVIRCDPHAVGQSTKTYEFKLWVAVGDREAQLMTIDPDGRLKAALQELITRCIRAGGP
ncbi:MAG: hypothetical protein ACR2JP_05880 [Acidimicrobiia bacterium]